MRLSYKWLSEYVDLSGISPEELATKMTTAGLEVEGIETLAYGTKLVIGEVLESEDIPDTHLHSTKTRVSDTEILDIVCGAPNCRKGLKVIVALPGCELRGGTISAKPVRGYASNGMLCSLLELDVDKKYLTEKQMEGIEELPEDAPVGETKVLEYLGYDDTVLDVSLTPNRADCSSMWNMAKEVGAILHRDVKWPDYEGKADIGGKTDFTLHSTTEKCPAFVGKVVGKVKVKETPKWMVNYLHAAGINSINNVVDISNFVMLETGQPLHYYNLAKLPKKEITVVDDVEMTFVALDGLEFPVEKGDIMITTGGEPTGIAGIMGGEESMIDEQTQAIFIEAACFDAASVRKTSIRMNLLTEAAQRFTKGVDPQAMKKAVDRSVQLLQEYAEADDFEETIVMGNIDESPRIVKESLTHLNALLGTKFTMDEVVEQLKWLDFKPEVKGEEISCTIPSYRRDIERAADIDEEVIRLIGFDQLESTLPTMEATVGKLSPMQSLRRKTREAFSSMGVSEIVTYTLISEEYARDAHRAVGELIPLAMPISEARKYIRPSLMNSVLECVAYNEARQNSQNHFFELSKVYGKGQEAERLAIVLDGNVQEDVLHKYQLNGDFYTLKGMILTWLEKLGYTGSRILVCENTCDREHFHPYRSAEIYLDKKLLGVFGEIHPLVAKKFDIKKVYYAELELDVLSTATAARLKFNAINRYPSVERDIAIVVEKDVKASDLLYLVKKSGGKLVKNAHIFDVYEGEHVEKGMKSVALRIVYEANDRTLKEEEISEVHQKILASLSEKMNATLRG
ncbi:MAG: phenylalanine--tRNA ligase subunit beta [Solobacterium sp.]|nr:phenylalanine--tRNA ligase subunit beta [Solobacterium sp.]